MAGKVIDVAGKKVSEEEVLAALQNLEKIRERRSKAKEKRQSLSKDPAAMLIRKKKAAVRRAGTLCIVAWASKQGYNPSDAEKLAFAKAKWPDLFK